METYSHGADIYTAAETTGTDEDSILDFSSNINPLGMPEGVEQAILDSIKYAKRYPDIKCRNLAKALSEYEGVNPEQIFCSAGAAEAIYRIAIYLKPKTALLISPTFGEYEEALRTVDCNIKYHCLQESEGFSLTDRILDDLTLDIDIIFICNPNNPTGLLTDKRLAKKIADKCLKNKTYVVVDECFMDFVENSFSYSLLSVLQKYDNLMILKAFTKIYAMAGIRLGYCISSDRNITKGLQASGPPWNVSSVAQYAGIAALNQVGFVEKTIDYVSKERRFMIEKMKTMGFEVYDSAANYIFFRCVGRYSHDLKELMQKKGVLIRSCSNYRNLGSGFYRVAVKSSEDNLILIQKMKELFT